MDDTGLWVPDVAWADTPADESGNANIDYVVPETWLDKTLQLTAMGLSSGLIATTTFTDHTPHDVGLSRSPPAGLVWPRQLRSADRAISPAAAAGAGTRRPHTQ